MKNQWDQYCFLRANNPSKYGWVGLALVVVVVLALAGAVYLGAIWYV